MITGASRKPFSGVRSPVVALNENVLPGRDQGPVDQVRDQRDVMKAVRDPAVGRVIARDDAGDAHRLRVGDGPLGLRRLDGERRRPRVRRDRQPPAAPSRSPAPSRRGRPCRARCGSRPGTPRSWRPPARAPPACAASRTTPRRPARRSRASSRRRSEARAARRSASAAASSACPRTRGARAQTGRSRAWRRAVRARQPSPLPGRSAPAAAPEHRDRAGRARGRSSSAARSRSSFRPLCSGTTSIPQAAAYELRLEVVAIDRRGEPARACSRAQRCTPGRAERSRLRRSVRAGDGSRARARSPHPRGRLLRARRSSRPRR